MDQDDYYLYSMVKIMVKMTNDVHIRTATNVGSRPLVRKDQDPLGTT